MNARAIRAQFRHEDRQFAEELAESDARLEAALLSRVRRLVEAGALNREQAEFGADIITTREGFPQARKLLAQVWPHYEEIDEKHVDLLVWTWHLATRLAQERERWEELA